MGNVTHCMAGKAQAKVTRPDGTIVEYTYPVQVAMLMALHPDYLVIQCPDDAGSKGVRRKIKVMEKDDRVVLGQSYVMYPIPSQFAEDENFLDLVRIT